MLRIRVRFVGVVSAFFISYFDFRAGVVWLVTHGPVCGMRISNHRVMLVMEVRFSGLLTWCAQDSNQGHHAPDFSAKQIRGKSTLCAQPGSHFL
jgi:hypothetical protein